MPRQGCGEGNVFNTPSPEQPLGAAARQDMESLSPGDQTQTLLSSAGTKVYNLCHGVTEALGERQLSPFPEPSTKSMAAKAKTHAKSSLLVGVARDGDPVPGFQLELSLATSSRGTLAACPCFWAAHHQHSTALSGFQNSQPPSLPCTLQAVTPLPVPTTCARGQSHLHLVLLRKGFKLSPASASFLPSCCLFYPGCDLLGWL